MILKADQEVENLDRITIFVAHWDTLHSYVLI